MRQTAHREHRLAALAVWGLGFWYAFHCLNVHLVGPRNEHAAASFWAVYVIGAITVSLVAWAGLSVWRRGRLVGAFALTALLVAAGGISSILALKSKAGEFPTFTPVVIMMFLWGTGTILLLMRAYVAREAPRHRPPHWREHGRTRVAR